MGTPDAGKLFLQALTGSGLEDIDLDHAPNFDTIALHSIYDIQVWNIGYILACATGH